MALPAQEGGQWVPSGSGIAKGDHPLGRPSTHHIGHFHGVPGLRRNRADPSEHSGIDRDVLFTHKNLALIRSSSTVTATSIGLASLG
jgi:hypothetical protein